MAYTQTKLLGATVTGFSTNANWNDQGTTCTVNVVEDKNSGDYFVLADDQMNGQGQLIGTPVSFQMGNFRFDGVITSYLQKNDFQGNPVYEVRLMNPVFLLDAAQVIVSNYVGPVNDSVFNSQNSTPTFQLSNVLNVYGYLEQGGFDFGNSQINDTGLLWEGPVGVKQAIETLTNSPPANTFQTNWGTHLYFKGHYYKVDLSAIPTAPAFFRLPASVYTSILNIINTICQDAGVRYLIQLELGEGNGPHRIYLKVADLVIPNDLNIIRSYIQSQDNIVSSTVGQELRTSGSEFYSEAMILGGDITVLQPLENWDPNDPAVIPFWGFDLNGNPLLGRKPNGLAFADDDYEMNLNGSAIAGILGSVGLGPVYPTKILELRCALADYDSWAAYLYTNNQQFADALGIYGAASGPLNGFEQTLVQDFVNDQAELAKQLGSMNEDDHWQSVSQVVYNFVRTQAETYYGRQFLVKFPFQVQIKIVPETSQVVYSDEPCDAGYLPDGEGPLGLNFVNESFFLSSDNRFMPFFRFQLNSQFNSVYSLSQGTTDTVTANASSLPDSYVVQYDNNPSNIAIYAPYQILQGAPVVLAGSTGGGSIIFVQSGAGLPQPALICTIEQPIFAQGADSLGGVSDIATILNTDPSVIINAAQLRSDSFPFKLHPPAFYPNGAAVALKSNQYVYGPWGKFVSDGGCYLERDESLTPWEYGGYAAMAEAAIAKLGTVATANQVKETGSITQAGLPSISLGDILIQDGPTVNSIEAEVNLAGVTTTYTMETFVPRIGVFNQENAARIMRFGQLSQQMKRSLRQLFLLSAQRQATIFQSRAGALFGVPTSYAVQQRTPHGVIGGHTIFDSGVQGYVSVAYMQTYRESVANICANNDSLFQTSACMGLEGLFRPFSTNPDASGISHYYKPDDTIKTKTDIYVDNLNPFQDGSDVYWLSFGDTYDHLNIRKGPGDSSNSRGFGVKGPMQLSGWGYDINGKPVPNSAASGADPFSKYSTDFADDYLNNSTKWPTGPVDLRWDKLRGVWMSPGAIFYAQASGDINGQGTGTASLMLDDGSVMGESFQVMNRFKSTVPDQTTLTIGYDPLINQWIVISADCPDN
jgi:hypothetical protein